MTLRTSPFPTRNCTYGAIPPLAQICDHSQHKHPGTFQKKHGFGTLPVLHYSLLMKNFVFIPTFPYTVGPGLQSCIHNMKLPGYRGGEGGGRGGGDVREGLAVHTQGNARTRRSRAGKRESCYLKRGAWACPRVERSEQPNERSEVKIWCGGPQTRRCIRRAL